MRVQRRSKDPQISPRPSVNKTIIFRELASFGALWWVWGGVVGGGGGGGVGERSLRHTPWLIMESSFRSGLEPHRNSLFLAFSRISIISPVLLFLRKFPFSRVHALACWVYEDSVLRKVPPSQFPGSGGVGGFPGEFLFQCRAFGSSFYCSRVVLPPPFGATRSSSDFPFLIIPLEGLTSLARDKILCILKGFFSCDTLRKS